MTVGCSMFLNKSLQGSRDQGVQLIAYTTARLGSGCVCVHVQ